MMPGLRRIAVVLTAALTFAAATIPTKAEAFGFLLGPVLLGSAFIGAGAGGWGRGDGGPWGGGGGWDNGCGGCQAWAPPPPPPPRCCYYGDWDGGRGGWGRGGYGGGDYDRW